MNLKRLYDIVFIVALEEEAKILSKAFGAEQLHEEAFGIYAFKELKVSFNEFWRKKQIGLLCLKEQGPEHASNGTTALLNEIDPAVLVSIGLSGNLADDCALGDVVVARSSYNYTYRVRVSSHEVNAAGRTKETSNIADTINQLSLADYLQGLEPAVSLGMKQALITSGIIHKYPAVRYGDIASGPYLIDNKEFQGFLKSKNRKLLAVDMESSAVLESASGMKYTGSTIVIRGISDYADGTKRSIDEKYKRGMRQTAMNSACAMFRFLVEDCFDPVVKPLTFVRPFRHPRPVVGRLLLLIEALESHLADKSAAQAAHDTMEHACADDPLIGISLLGEFAYRYRVRHLDMVPKVLGERLQRASTFVTDFLVAHFVVDSIRQLSPRASASALQPLENVYSVEVNQYCKALMNRELRTRQRKFFDNLLSAYSTPVRRKAVHPVSQIRRRAQVAYLMGRVEGGQYRQEAVDALKKWRHQLLDERFGVQRMAGKKSKSSPDDSLIKYRWDAQIAAAAAESGEFRLLLRTLQISLVVLGEKAVSDEYILQCMANEKYDSQNRGFHLEYYGDIIGAEDKLNKEDVLNQNFLRALEALRKGLLSSAPSEADVCMHDIQLYTLLSLAHHRHLHGTLQPVMRTAVIDLLNSLRWKSINPELMGYLLLVKDHLADAEVHLTSTLEKLFDLKKLKRKGWNDLRKDRFVDNPESVASHTFGAMALAYMLLPETSVGPRAGLTSEYSKEKILRYLLVHDFAEAWIGDLLPDEKSQEKEADEAEAYRRLASNFTYGGYSGRETYRDWYEFEKGNSINAILARDLDQLDSLLQMSIEIARQGNRIPDRVQWQQSIEKRLSSWGTKAFRFIIDQEPIAP